jgi:hypothetical protein
MHDNSSILVVERGSDPSQISVLLDLSLAKVVHGKISRKTKGIEGDVLTDVSPAVFRVREKRDGRHLLSVESGSGLGGLTKKQEVSFDMHEK